MEKHDRGHELIDTHCHLYLDEFSHDLDECISRARNEGVKRIFMPAIDKSHFSHMRKVELAYPDVCRSMIGLHPCYVKENYLEELDFVRSELEQGTFAAIGEIGLDYYWSRSFDDLQMTCFRDQLALARTANLPVVIHSRNSMSEVIEVLREESKLGTRGIFHCFSGTYENALDVIECGFLLGIGGVVTYKNAGLAEVLSRIDVRHLVLETDGPYLTPVPFRGKRNESSYVKYIAEKIAEVKGLSVEEVAEATTRNARAIFNLA